MLFLSVNEILHSLNQNALDVDTPEPSMRILKTRRSLCIMIILERYMKTQIISCKTIKLEVEKAMHETGCKFPASWIESGLHNFPDKLRRNLQETLDGINAERVLLVMGYCCNSLVGLKTRDFELIFPRADDCITLLLGSLDTRKMHERTYFLTKGWLDGERNVYEEYKYTIKKYGLEQGKEIMKMMLEHYEYLGIMNTGVCDFDELCEKTKKIAFELGLSLKTIEATDLLLKNLLTGPWANSEFHIIPCNTVIEISHLS